MQVPRLGTGLRVSLLYFLFGISWIFITDHLLEGWVPNPQGYARFQTIKGWIFIALSTGLIYFLLRRQLADNQNTLKKLQEASDLFYSLFNASLDAVVLGNPDGTVQAANPTACRMFQYTEEEMIRGGRYLILERDDPRLQTALEERQRTGKFSGELTFVRKNGERFPGEISTTLFQDSRGETHSSVIIRDLSEQKSVKERYTHLNRLLSTQSQVNRAIVRAGNRQSLFKEICDAAVEHGNYRMAWIGLIDEREQLVKPVCFSGKERGYLDGLKISTLEDKNGMGPTGRAVREGVCVISQDISQDPCMVPWRERALSHGFLSSAAVPIRLNGVVTGVLSVYSSEVEGLDEQDRNQLEEIGESISFALDTFQKEAARREAQLAVQREKALYQDMMSTQPAGVYRLRLERITDPASGQETSTTQIEMFSDRIFEITGLSRETFDNNLEHFYAIFEPEDLLRFKQASSATQFTLTPLSWEGRIRKQGEIRWIRIESIPRQIRPDEWIWTGMVYDITYRKQVEAQLEAQLEELQRWQKATLGREARILELKREVNDLLAQNSLPARYPAAELDI